MYTWGDVYGRQEEHYISRDSELEQIHLAELAAEQKAERKSRAHVILSLVALPLLIVVHILTGVTRIGMLRN